VGLMASADFTDVGRWERTGDWQIDGKVSVGRERHR
jgi:hypothetical protein